MNIPDSELKVLKALWKCGPLTIRELSDSLYPEAGNAGAATVQKLLERLRAKRCVDRRRAGRGHVYSAVIDRDEIIGTQLRETAERLCGGSLTPLLSQLLDARELSREDPEALRDLIERLERGLAREEAE